MSDFKITDEDISAVVRYLKIFHPENANRKFALLSCSNPSNPLSTMLPSTIPMI